MGPRDLKIEHHEERGQFVATVDGDDAVLSYGRIGNDVLEYRSTYVPPALRHRGIATALAIRALDYARAGGFRVVPSCWFVAKVIDEHPEYADLAAP